MKKYFIVIIILFTFTANMVSQTTYSIVVEDTPQPQLAGAPVTVNLPARKQARLRSSFGGNVKTYYVGDFSPSMKTAIEQAVDLWKAQLKINDDKTIPLIFVASALGDLATSTRVSYQNVNGTSYAELACVNKGLVELSDTSMVVTRININCDSDFWSYYLDNEPDPSRTDLSTAAARAIGHALGFGTSLVLKNPKRVQYELAVPNVYSNFDKYITDIDENVFSSIPTTSTSSVYTAFTAKRLFVLGHELYTASSFDNNYSLRTFANGGELMSKDLRKGDRILEINEKTKECMALAGWEFAPFVNFNIYHSDSDINITGILSALSSHTFTISSSATNISNYQWELKLVNTSGNYVTVKTGTSSSFTIDPISNLNAYKKNTNGDIEGKLLVSATVNGQLKSDDKTLCFESKPARINVREVSLVHGVNSGYFDVVFDVEYFGGEYLHMYAEQSGVTSIYEKVIGVKDHAVFTYRNLRFGRYIWFDFTTENQYGTTMSTYEMEPVSSSSLNVTSRLVSSITVDKEDASEIAYLKVMDVYGKYEWYYNVRSISNLDLPSGLYIVTEFDSENNIISTKKTLIK